MLRVWVFDAAGELTCDIKFRAECWPNAYLPRKEAIANCMACFARWPRFEACLQPMQYPITNLPEHLINLLNALDNQPAEHYEKSAGGEHISRA